MYANEPSLKTAELSVAKKLSEYGTTVPRYLPDELGMLLHRLGERAEDDAERRQLLLERRRHRHAVEDRVDGDAGRAASARRAGCPSLSNVRADLGIDLVEALQRRLTSSARSSR